ncbi:MAG: flotillin family protein [Cyanobacteria bacterium RU_5_0]|nr:flotillin family protein [Cyanobacteria bacterium RU_5_0]
MVKFNFRRQGLPFAASLLTTVITTGTITQPPAQANSLHPRSPESQVSLQQPQLHDQQLMQLGGFSLPIWIYPIGGIILLLIFLPQIGWIMGLIVIGEREVGIVTKKFSSKSLPAGQLIALNGEAGLQADTLSPGWHFGYFPWQYAVRKELVVMISQGEIGLVVASDGRAIPPDRILGKVVESEDFQDARQFLTNGGERGQQLAILTAGTYRINTALFEVISTATAAKHGMDPARLKVYAVRQDKVGIVTTLDGMPIEEGEIAGPITPDHDNFQKPQTFIGGGGRRGLQEQVILSGSWNLNPWFVQVEQVLMTEVPIGYVGVVISYVGQSHEDISGESFTHGNLVSKGDKGVWIEPLYPGRHPLNTHIMKVELVPTTNIVLNFTSRFSGEHGYDSKLDALRLLSFDGFTFELEVFQIIHVGALDAPKVISRLGSMQNLVDQVLRPIVGNYFRNSAQEYTILDFLTARSERQAEAAEHVRCALRAYDVQAVDTLIGRISPPPELMQTLTDRKIAEEQQKTYEVQRVAQTQRQELVRETALADIQKEVVTAEQGVKIAELHATAQVKQANGEAESIRVTGQAKADAYQAGVTALGPQAYTALQLMQVVGDRNVRVVPDVAVSGNSNGSGLIDGLMGMMLWNQTKEMHTKIGNGNQSLMATSQPEEES